MDNKINPRRSPEYGCFEFVPRKPAEASSLPVGNATNSADAPARPASPQIVSGKPEMSQAHNAKARKQPAQESETSTLSVKKLKPAETTPPPAARDSDIKEGYKTPENVNKSVPVLPGAPRFEYKDTDSGARPRGCCMNLQKYFASLESQENSPIASDSSQEPAESKKPC